MDAQSLNVRVLEVLHKAVTQNVKVMAEAELQLQAWGSEPTFPFILLDIAFDQSLPTDVRCLSLLFLKNNINKYEKSVISEEQLCLMMEKILSDNNLKEPNNQIACMTAVVFRKVFSMSGLQHIFNRFKSSFQSHDMLLKSRALLFFTYIRKKMQLSCIFSDDPELRQEWNSLNLLIMNEWDIQSRTFLEIVESDTVKASLSLELALLCMKSLKSTIDVILIIDRIHLVFQKIEPFLQCRMKLQNQLNMFLLCEKYIILLLKMLLRCISMERKSIIPVFPTVLQLCTRFCFSDNFQGILFEDFTIYLMIIMVAVLSFPSRRFIRRMLEENDYGKIHDYNQIMDDFFTPAVLKEIINQLISKYLILNERDVNCCEMDPETYASTIFLCDLDFDADDISEKLSSAVCEHQVSVRMCAEVLFLKLYGIHNKVLQPIIMEIVNNISVSSDNDDLCECFPKLQLQPTFDVTDTLRREAVYTLLGLGLSPRNFEYDFDKWLIDVFIPELKIKDHGYSIVKRRVIWIIEKWKKFTLSDEQISVIFRTVLELMNDENLVVQIAAVQTFKSIDYLGYKNLNWKEKLPEILNAVCSIYIKIGASDLKVILMQAFSRVMEMAENSIQPHITTIIEFLLTMMSSVDENLLQSSIISCFVKIVKSLQTTCESLQIVLVPLIYSCLDDSKIHLLEVGLELWLTFLENVSVCSPEILNLLQKIQILFENIFEYHKYCTEIIKVYLYLAPDTFLEKYGEEITREFESSYKKYEILNLKFLACDGHSFFKVEESHSNDSYVQLYWIPEKMKTECISFQLGRSFEGKSSWIFEVVEIAMVLMPGKDFTLFQPIFMTAIDLVLHEKQCHLDFTFHLTLVSRLILTDAELFKNLLQQKANERNMQIQNIVMYFVNVFIKQVSVQGGEVQKLLALTLIYMIDWALQFSQEFHKKIEEIFASITKAILNDRFGFFQDNKKRKSRKEKAKLSNIVYAAKVKDFFFHHMALLEHRLGPSLYKDVMSKVDQRVTKRLELAIQGEELESESESERD